MRLLLVVLLGLVLEVGCKKAPTGPQKTRYEDVLLNGFVSLDYATDYRRWEWNLNKDDTLIVRANTKDWSATLYAAVADEGGVKIREEDWISSVDWTVGIEKTCKYYFGVSTYEEYGEDIVVYVKRIYWK